VSNPIKKIFQIIVSPIYLVAILVGLLIQSHELANWGSEGLGLAAKRGEGLTGSEGLIGKEATVERPFLKGDSGENYLGKVFVRGELWQASISPNHKLPEKGEKVRILEVQGLILKVEPIV